MRNLLSEILTQADDGTEYVIQEFAPDEIPAGHLENPGQMISRKLKTFVTADGEVVNRIDDDTFEVLAVSGPITVRRMK